MGLDETMQRNQELDLHCFRQTEYRIRFRLRHSDPCLPYRAFPTTPCRLMFPENPRPDPCLSLPRFRIDRNRQRRSHEPGYPDLTQPVIDKDDVLATAPLCSPMHQ